MADRQTSSCDAASGGAALAGLPLQLEQLGREFALDRDVIRPIGMKPLTSTQAL
jgi:hypothetical protein